MKSVDEYEKKSQEEIKRQEEERLKKFNQISAFLQSIIGFSLDFIKNKDIFGVLIEYFKVYIPDEQDREQLKTVFNEVLECVEKNKKLFNQDRKSKEEIILNTKNLLNIF
ncbi:MAG: hypothetical protein RLZ35_619, partial [Pseudomonadota bacterium]